MIARVGCAALCLSLITGCMTYAGSHKVARVGGYGMVGGVVVLLGGFGLAAAEGGSARGESIGMAGLALSAATFGAGMVLAVSGGIGMGIHDRPGTTTSDPAPLRANGAPK